MSIVNSMSFILISIILFINCGKKCECLIPEIDIENTKIENLGKKDLDSLTTGVKLELPVLKKWIDAGGELNYAYKNKIIENKQATKISKFNKYEKEIFFQTLVRNASCSEYINICKIEGKKSSNLTPIISEYSKIIMEMASKLITPNTSECEYINTEINKYELEIEIIENRLKQGIINDTLEASLLTNRSLLIDYKKKYQNLNCQ